METKVTLRGAANILRLTPRTKIDRENELLYYTYSEFSGRTKFHRKLKLYQNKYGYYVNICDMRCYIGELLNNIILEEEKVL